MKKLILPLILFFFLVLEGVAIDLLPPILVVGDYMMAPHWVLVFLALITIFYDKKDTYIAVVYAIVFGFLIDIVYTEILGVYMFTYAVVIYLIHSLMKVLQSNFYVTLAVVIGGLIASDVFIHFVYTVIGIAEISWKNYFTVRLLPSLLANILFLLIIYPILVKLLVKWSKEEYSD
ncbi:rod shape-determining protein MreD [Ornithinibacillus halophilus]|uniref:Rod shape-determining protein MreD n=1 Tax=Ornithinibacillus halophilus TaxID=930117 RepID=A0A1M5DEN1_9BACI|nr:rod shape-determining protein MreD [Ornithinibacillus halophilus]SHF65400.1 rod shape-determining protein MreD [Ornithinibacillus halophilus]